MTEAHSGPHDLPGDARREAAECDLTAADELASLAYGLRLAASGAVPLTPLAEGLETAAAAADHLGRMAYTSATNRRIPQARILPIGAYAEQVYGPGADLDSTHYQPGPEWVVRSTSDDRSGGHDQSMVDAVRGGAATGIARPSDG